MKFSALLLSASIAISSVVAIPYSRAHQQAHQHAKRQTDYTAVVGPGGSVHPRLEIRQMYWNRPNQYTLLLLALEQWQAMSQSDKLSYYQISGIHGVPRVDWDGVAECDECDGADGYCPHDSVLFPAWHRVYVALFEQVFLTIVDEIASSWTGDGAATIQAAASQMRWPYWDWAAQPKSGYNSFPAIMSMKYATVTGPSSTSIIINPLFRYAFQDNSDLVYYPFVDNWDYTFRYPTTDDTSATSTTASVVAAFNNIQSSLQDQVYQMFSTCTDYLYFSNDDSSSSSDSCSNSIEGIHNTVHTTTGGTGSSSVEGGHMTYLSLAAFDPVFWLHHANVDRLFAMWQTLNPDSYGASQIAPHNTWTIAAGTTQDADSPLEPMHKDTAGDFYSTNDVEDWTIFSYTYPEFADSDGSASAIASYVSALYGPSATATAGSSKRDLISNLTSTTAASLPTPTSDPLANLTGALTSVIASSNLTNPVEANNGSAFQYVANLQTSRYALNGSYQIYLFNGQPTSEDPASWVLDSNLIGPVGVLAQPGMNDHNVTVAASVPLTRSLKNSVTVGVLTDLSEELVVPYLNANLYWRVAGPDGTSVASDTIPDFSIQVFASTAPQVAQGELPTWSTFIPLEDAVQNCTTNSGAARK